MSSCNCHIEMQNKEQSRVLIILLAINATMFVIELSIGWWAESTALIADALDMLADSMVYAIGLYAVGRSMRTKVHAAYLNGGMQVILGLMVLVDIIRRFIYGSEPVSELMMGIGLLALLANITCLVLISKHRHGDINMRASWICSQNDVIANTGVILAGVLVLLTESNLPDLLIGIVVAAMVIRGGMHILSEAKNTSAEQAKSEAP